MQIYRRLLSYTAAYRPQLCLAILGMVLYAGSATAFAALMKPMLDGSFVDRDSASIVWVPILIIVVFLLRGIGGFCSTYFMAWIGWHIVKRIRRQLFDKYLNLPSSHFDVASSGEMISRVTFNVRNISVVAADCRTVLVRDTLTIIGLLGLMIYHSWKLSLGFLILGPVVALIVRFVSRRFRRLSRGIQDSMGQVASVIEEVVNGQRLVKVFGGQQYEREHFDEVNERNRVLNVKETATRAGSSPVIQFLVAVALAIIVYLASSGVLVGEVTVGVFMSFITAMMMLFAPLKQLTNVNAKIQAGVAAGENVFAMLDLDSERDEGRIALQAEHISIEFNRVYFEYQPDVPVLRDLSFSVARGEVVALVGGSGSGKSTIASLLPRLYDATEGTVLINDRDVRAYTLDSLRGHISYVGQDVTLFNDTVRANIAYGDMRDLPQEKVERACQIAHADGFIRGLQQGYETIVGENGVMLSGGQRQRLAIARAILKDAPLLVLDEATSALDTESERSVQQGLQALMKNRTTVVIAHRLSTIENADRIVVMDQGRIVESGTHCELLARGGHYAVLHGSAQDDG
jgi:subfamily B ATP-binding cassette protein MsbA